MIKTNNLNFAKLEVCVTKGGWYYYYPPANGWGDFGKAIGRKTHLKELLIFGGDRWSSNLYSFLFEEKFKCLLPRDSKWVAQTMCTKERETVAVKPH
jgi:hypothetical protein